jgi:hypothetical protein
MDYKDVDNVVALGKWALGRIPDGSYCKSCPILKTHLPNPYCDLRPSIGLNYDSTHVFKDTRCPKKRTE